MNEWSGDQRADVVRAYTWNGTVTILEVRRTDPDTLFVRSRWPFGEGWHAETRNLGPLDSMTPEAFDDYERQLRAMIPPD